MQNRSPSNTAVRSSDFVIRINSFEDRIMRGALEHSGSGDFMEFYGLVNFIEAVQNRLDELEYPQATMEMRSWKLPPALPASAEGSHDEAATSESGNGNLPEGFDGSGEASRHKTLASFVLRIQFRHNACWQGSLAWLEGKKSVAFRSMLELVALVSSALDAAGSPNQSPWKTSASWKAAATVS